MLPTRRAAQQCGPQTAAHSLWPDRPPVAEGAASGLSLAPKGTLHVPRGEE